LTNLKKKPKTKRVAPKNQITSETEEQLEYRNPGGRPSVMTDDRKEAILEALRDGMPQRYAAHLVGIHHETLRLYLERDLGFLAKCNVAKAIGIGGLVQLTKEQNGAWKLLKNIGKEEFKEHIDISYDESKPITIHGTDGEEII
jgi:hypothetical protein